MKTSINIITASMWDEFRKIQSPQYESDCKFRMKVTLRQTLTALIEIEFRFVVRPTINTTVLS
jgi:hypothetical protein